MARVVEGWTQKEGENHGRLYSKCARYSVSSLICLPNLSLGSYVLLILQYAKNCGFYRFHKEYLQILKDDGVIVFRPSNWADAVDEAVDSVECQIGSGEERQALEDKQRKKVLEEKMDNVIWKMNLIIVVVVCVVFGCLLGIYAAKK
jgi:hypothetical protein